MSLAFALLTGRAMRFASLILLAGSLVGCATAGDDSLEGGNGKADGNGSCTVPEYGDGVCQIDIACDVPDIDCYTQFDNDDAAAAWLATQMQYARVYANDPRVARARTLVDRAYEIFKTHTQLGKLADHPLAVVVLEGDANAFVAGDAKTNKGGWSVQVQSGILSGEFTDDEIIGVMQHELTHLAKLHFIPEVHDRIRKFYVAPDGKEPIGEQTAENPFAKQYGDAWRKAAQLTGPYANPELGAFPLGGDLGQIAFWYVTENLVTTCSAQSAAYNDIYTSLNFDVSRLDSSLTLPAGYAPMIASALQGVLQCGGPAQPTLRVYLDSQAPEWVPYIQSQLAPDEVPLLDKPILEAITTLVSTHRQQMIAAQTGFTHDTTRPWNALRFYSFEEAADDGWIRSYQASHLDGPGSFKGAFMNFLQDQATACQTALTANNAPYGANLTDEHHGSCWRIAHAAQIAAPQTTARTVEEPRIAHVPRVIPQPPGLHPIY